MMRTQKIMRPHQSLESPIKQMIEIYSTRLWRRDFVRLGYPIREAACASVDYLLSLSARSKPLTTTSTK
jgi:hypothetical protein